MKKFIGLASLRRLKEGGDPSDPTIALDSGPGLAAPRGSGGAWSPSHEVKAASLTGPRLTIEGSLKEAIQRLLEVTEAAYAGRGMPGMVKFAEVAVRAAAAFVRRQTNEGEDWRFPLRGLEIIFKDAKALPEVSRGGMTATRANRVLALMSELPAHDGEGYVKMIRRSSDSKGLVVTRTDDARNAVKAYDYFIEMHPGFDEVMLNSFSTAKTTPKFALRDTQLSMMQRTLPDLGAPMVLAALNQEGYKDDANETPLASFAYPGFGLLIWAEHVLHDLRRVLDDRDGNIRGELYSSQVRSPTGEYYTAESYAALVRALEPIVISDKVTTPKAKEAARKIRQSKPAYYDALIAEYESLQRKISPKQNAAVAACDMLIAFVRHNFDLKGWHRRAKGLEYSVGRAGDGRRRPPEPRPPHPDEFEYVEEEGRARAAPMEPEPAQADGGDYVFTVPDFQLDMSWLDLRSADVNMELQAHGIDGWRQFRGTDFGDTLWKVVVGPTYFLLDILKEEDDLRIVMIAPQREGSTSPDLGAMRAIKLVDYLLYFSLPEGVESA